MDLSKLSRANLEGVVNNMLEDLESEDNDLVDKYYDLIDEMIYYIDNNEAEKIVKNMKPYGQAYSIEDVRNMLQKLNISTNYLVHYYLCMNMFYNDYKTYAESKRLDINDFCFEMSKLFIQDVDAPKYKVEKYFKNA